MDTDDSLLCSAEYVIGGGSQPDKSSPSIFYSFWLKSILVFFPTSPYFKAIPSLRTYNPKLVFVIFLIASARCTLSILIIFDGRSRRPCDLRRRFASDRLLGSLGSNSAAGMDVLLLGLLCVVR